MAKKNRHERNAQAAEREGEMQAETGQSEGFVLKALSRRDGTCAIYDIAVEVDEGGDVTVKEESLTRKTISMRASAMEGRVEPHYKRAYAYYAFLLSLFPPLPPDMDALRGFAAGIDFDLAENGKPVEDPERAWEMLFGESCIIHREPVYALPALNPPQ